MVAYVAGGRQVVQGNGEGVAPALTAAAAAFYFERFIELLRYEQLHDVEGHESRHNRLSGRAVAVQRKQLIGDVDLLRGAETAVDYDLFESIEHVYLCFQRVLQLLGCQVFEGYEDVAQSDTFGSVLLLLDESRGDVARIDPSRSHAELAEFGLHPGRAVLLLELEQLRHLFFAQAAPFHKHLAQFLGIGSVVALHGLILSR